jgi:hypothetical protein
MTREQALKILLCAPLSRQPCAIKPDLTQAEAVGILTRVVREIAPGTTLDDFMVKRVYQVSQNRYHPKIMEATA